MIIFIKEFAGEYVHCILLAWDPVQNRRVFLGGIRVSFDVLKHLIGSGVVHRVCIETETDTVPVGWGDLVPYKCTGDNDTS